MSDPAGAPAREPDLRARIACAMLLALAAACGGATDAAGKDERRGGADAPELDLELPRARVERESAPPRERSSNAREEAADLEGASTDGVAFDASADERTDLERGIDAAIARALAAARKGSDGKAHGGNCVVAVHVRALGEAEGADRVLADVAGDVALIPASNLKILTVATALAVLGGDGCFETRFEAAGEVRDGALAGDLVAVAGGDPLYDPAARGAVDRFAEDLAAQLRSHGVRRVDGALVLDDSDWLAPGVPDGWPAPADHWQAYCARCAGFSANAGCLTASVTPARSGAPAAVTLLPRDDGLSRRIDVATGPRGSGNDVRIGATRSSAVVRGSIAEGLPELVVEFAHPDPVDLFGHAVAGGLARAGIELRGGFARGEPAVARAAAGAARREVARWRTPIVETFPAILGDSNNPVADQLFLAAGHRHAGRGDRAAGLAAMQAALERLGVEAAGLVAVDGSGLSKVDRCTAAQLTAVLAAVARRPAAESEPFRAALPVAGESGKLASRMRGTPAAGRVRAKTGFVSGASSLSGYGETVAGERFAFSILVNYPRIAGLNNSAWKPMQDEICALLVAEAAH